MTDQDRLELWHLDSDPEVMRYLTDGKASTEQEITSMLERIQLLYKKYEGRFGVWAAIDKSTQDFIGWFLLRPDKEDPDNLKRIEIGYRLKKSYWGHGIATECAQVLLNKGFRELDIDEIFAVAMKKNEASQNVMKKIGLNFSHEFDYLEFPGTDKTAVLYKLSKKQWLSGLTTG